MRAHLSGREDDVTALAPALDRFPRLADLLDDIALDAPLIPPRHAELISRGLGAPAFLDASVAQTYRRPRPQPRGPKPKAAQRTEDDALRALSPKRPAPNATIQPRFGKMFTAFVSMT